MERGGGIFNGEGSYVVERGGGRHDRGRLKKLAEANASICSSLHEKIMNLLKINLHTRLHHHQAKLWPEFQFLNSGERISKISPFFARPLYPVARNVRAVKVSAAIPFSIDNNKEDESEDFEDYLAEDGEVYQKTLRLVECAMFAAVSALAFLLSNSLAIEKYFACFFALPIVLSTMRWGIAAGRKTMVATGVLLFILSGPVKAMTYLLLHGLLGFMMGTLWRLKANWGTSIFFCTIVRATGALANVIIASYLIGENILGLITINVHALVTNILSSMGIIAVPSMNLIYCIFGFLLLFNCGFFVFLLHLLYAIFFKRLGYKDSLRLPKWLEAAI